jgi:hypothetical protein
MRTWWAIPACAALLALAGCGSGNDGGTPGAESSIVGQQTGGDDSGTDPDSPVDAADQGAADLPSLPIGGDASFEAADTPICATVAFTWNGGTIPAGAVVRISSLSGPAGVSLDTSASCDGQPCLDADSFTGDQLTCTVGLSWDGTPPTDPESLTISASGAVACESQDLCDQVKSDAESSEGVMSVELPETTDPSSVST